MSLEIDPVTRFCQAFDLLENLPLGHARSFFVDAGHFLDCVAAFRVADWRFAGLWGDEIGAAFSVTVLLSNGQQYVSLVCNADGDPPTLDSISAHYPVADRMQRHCHDLWGIRFRGAEDQRRWIRHQAWSQDEFPLRAGERALRLHPRTTAPDPDYPCHRVQGAGVHEIPVGPVHAGIIEPGHFRFSVVGETILHLEQRLGYTHKGIEQCAVACTPSQLARLAHRVSGDTAVGHAWAACMALEQIAEVKIPPRAAWIRAILVERERVANHLGDIGGICNDVGFAFANVQFSRLRELWLRSNLDRFGHRLLMDTVTPGGVHCQLSAEAREGMRSEISALRGELAGLRNILDDYPSLEDRLVGTGLLTPIAAHSLGCLGFVARASGCDLDLRRDAPYSPYDSIRPRCIVDEKGDVMARVRVRADELDATLALLKSLLASLPDGEIRHPLPQILPPGQGLGMVEGWRGEIISFVRVGEDGRVARYFPRDPSWFNWPALELMMHGTIVPDFPVCNKSVNASYSGVDL